MQRMFSAGILTILICHSVVLRAQTTQEKELAQKRYKVGEQLYQISQYSKALIEFKQAYDLYPLPDMLLNIARCHEVLGDLDQALKVYRLFLKKKPESKYTSLVQSRIKSLERRLASKQEAKTPPEKAPPIVAPAPSEPATETTVAITPAPDTEEVEEAAAGRSWRWTAGWAGVGVGGAALVTGIVFGALAAEKSSEHDDARDKGGVYADLIAIQNTGESYQSAQIALMVVGGVVAAAGGGLLIWELLGREDEQSTLGAVITPMVLRGGMGFAGSLRF